MYNDTIWNPGCNEVIQYLFGSWCWQHWRSHVNSLWPRDAIWWQRSWSALVQVMVCCLMAPSHCLNQCWLIIKGVLKHSPERILTRSLTKNTWIIIWLAQSLQIIFISSCMSHIVFNSLSPARCGSNLRSIIFKLIAENSSLDTHWEIALRRTSPVRSHYWFR